MSDREPVRGEGTFESRTERNLVVASGLVFCLGIAGLVAFSGSRGTGPVGALLGHPGIDGIGISVSALLVVGSGAVIYYSDRLV